MPKPEAWELFEQAADNQDRYLAAALTLGPASGQSSPKRPLPTAAVPPHVPKDASCPELVLPPVWDQRASLGLFAQQLQGVEATLAAVRSSLAELAAGGTGASPSRTPTARPRTSRVSASPTSPPTSLEPSPVTRSPRQKTIILGTCKSLWSRKWSDKDTGKMVPEVFDQVIVGSAEAENMNRMEDTNIPIEENILDRDIIWTRLRIGRLKLCQVPMIHPDAKIRMIWLILGFAFIFYEAYAIPAYLAFDITPTGGLFVVVSTISTYFLCDIAMQFTLCYCTPYGSIICDPVKVGQRYIRTWFLFDILAGIPWEWFDTTGRGLNTLTRGFRMVRSARMLRLIRIARVMKIKAFMEQMDTYLEGNYLFMFISGVAKIIALLFAVCHWGACIFYAIGRGNEDVFHKDGVPASWLPYYQLNYPMIGKNKLDHYFYSLYFVLTTMTTVGYGDITPKSFDEVGFTMVLLLVSSVVFAGLMGTLTDMISALNSQTREINDKKMMLSRYMKWRFVPRRLMLRVRTHLLFLWEANKGYDAYEEVLKNELPPILKAELCNHVYGRILRTAPFLGWMKGFQICTKFLAERVRSMFLDKSDVIFRMGMPNEQIYILLTGEVTVTRNESLFLGMDADSDAKRVDLDFDMPRNTGDAASRSTEKIIANSGAFKSKAAESLGFMVAAKMFGVSKSSKITGMPNQEPRPPCKFGFRKTGNPFLDAEVMLIAHVELKRQDMRATTAARTLQRVWRKRLASRNLHSRKTGGKAAQGLEISRMTSKSVPSPAYFGESCLWQPQMEWNKPLPYMYTTRCSCRSEIIYIGRASIEEALDRFSPWLPERLELFRKVVAERMRSIAGLDTMMRDWQTYQSLDFGMADVFMPDDDLGLQDMHFKAIRRASDPNKVCREGPVKPREDLPSSVRKGTNGSYRRGYTPR